MSGETPDVRSPNRGTPAVETAGVRRRVIEGEGLGGFARRLTPQRPCRRDVPPPVLIFFGLTARRFWLF